ncbi:hypothetical protein [Salinispora sp. H7-4]|uniref:hypothetical protein n=1 Tax=Salinispora sp. H7-4 TaxID=2748321 RepID=UPI0015D1268D|nr:hypothetical protein [Salinispora sp. H7-4]NYT92352.1 hypothetical protein [Salinispora sp. H7-4]
MDQSVRTTPDEMMASIGAAVQLGRSGQRSRAREALTALWEQIGATGDALHRCTLAHYLADVQDTTQAELEWDERALAAADDLTDGRAQRYDHAWQVRLLLPSLHLNLADDHRRLGNPTRARKHLAQAQSLVTDLPDDQYGGMIRSGLQHVSEALAAGSTQRLDSHPPA